MFPRYLERQVLAALADTPVVLVHGARQTGKTTLVRAVGEGEHKARYFTLDDAAILAAAAFDPEGFVADMDGPVILDEVQRAPGLLLAIKASVDRRRDPGRFLLTGSANVLLVPKVADALAGRMEVLTLWPLAQQELQSHPGSIVDALFAERLSLPEVTGEPIRRTILRVLAGGYPEALGRKEHSRRDAWFGSYLTTILQRDVRDLANIDGITTVPRLLTTLASRAGSLLNVSELSRDVATPVTTLRRYLSLLETTFLIKLLPPWGTLRGRRIAKAPKLLFTDAGLMAHQLGLTAERLEQDRSLLGSMFEAFVAMELCKTSAWSKLGPTMSHYRTHAGQEVDVILEDRSGRTVGVEIKASRTVISRDFSGLNAFAEDCGDRFHRGIVLYTGSTVVPFGPRLHAVPVSALWQS
jgi:uncharacterized protein